MSISKLSSREIEYLDRKNEFATLFSKLEVISDEVKLLDTTSGLIFEKIKMINILYEEIFEFSSIHNIYWFNCNEQVYLSRLEKFKSKLLPELEICLVDILVDELNLYYKTNEGNGDSSSMPFFNESYKYLNSENHLYKHNSYKIKAFSRKKIELLKNEINKEGYSYILNDGQYVISKMKKSEEIEFNLNSNKPNQLENSDELNEYPLKIFKNKKSFELYNYLDENYIDSYEKGKYINLYHYLCDIDNVLICSQLKYIEFIKIHRDIQISKITPVTYKYKDKTISILKEYHRLFDLYYKNNTSE